MHVIEQENHYIILEDQNKRYLLSYGVLVATEENDILTFTQDWNYSQTTLKHLYDFIAYYCNAKDEKGEQIAYKIREQKNKKQFLQDLIDKKIIEVKESEVL